MTDEFDPLAGFTQDQWLELRKSNLLLESWKKLWEPVPLPAWGQVIVFVLLVVVLRLIP